MSFSNYTSGHPNIVMHHLTAHWEEVGSVYNGSEVACAIAVEGATQWFNSATLTVVASTETADERNDGNSIQTRDIVLVTVGIVLVVVIDVVCITGTILWYRRRYSENYRARWKPAPMEDVMDLVSRETT